MNSAGLNPCLGGTGGLGAGLASPVSAGLASGFCAGAGAAGALRWATGGCDTVSGAFFAAFGSDETGFAARARSASTASAWARRSEASFCAGISWFSRGVTGVFTTLTWAVAASFSFNLETCAAFTRPLAGRAVGLRVEIGFTAFFSRVEAAARAAARRPRGFTLLCLGPGPFERFGRCFTRHGCGSRLSGLGQSLAPCALHVPGGGFGLAGLSHFFDGRHTRRTPVRFRVGDGT